MADVATQTSRRVVHPRLGPGNLLKTYMSGYEFEVCFDSGRRFRLPAREFEAESAGPWQVVTGAPAPRRARDHPRR